MALTRYSGDTDIISLLDNQPNDNDGLSADQLKAKFDQFGTAFKEYLNNTLIPEIEADIGNAAAGISPTGISGSAIRDRTIETQKLSNSSGNEAVQTNVIKNGAVTKEKLASAVQNTLDAVAGKTTHSTVTVTLSSSSWSDYQQTVTATGVTASNTVIATSGTDDTSHNAWSNCDIRAISQASNSLTFKCRSVPTDNVTVNVLILN